MPEETIVPPAAPTDQAVVADAPAQAGTADAGADDAAQPTQTPEQKAAYEKSLGKLDALLKKANPRPEWQDGEADAKPEQRDTKPTAKQQDDPLVSLPAELIEAARREGGYTDDDIRDELTRDKQAAVRRFQRWNDARLRISADAGRAGSEKQKDAPAAKTAENALPTLTGEQLAAIGVEPELAPKLAATFNEALTKAVTAATAPLLTANEQRRRQEEDAQFFAVAQRVLSSVPEAKDLYGVGADRLDDTHLTNQRSTAALADLIIKGARADGNKALTQEQAFQLAHRAIAFDHVQTTERAQLNRQIKDRQSNFALPSGRAKAGRDAQRVVVTEGGNKVVPSDLQRIADIQRGRY